MVRRGQVFGAGAALALLLLLAPERAAAAESGAWAERVQVLYDAGSRSVVRRRLRVWDFQPQQNLDFVWEPAQGDRAKLAPDGTVSGEGKLVWRVRGAASYDPQTIFSTYAGHLEDGRPEGRGRLSLRSGEIFEGIWHAGLLDGEGVHVDTEGNRYEGTFKAGLAEGQGRLMLATGEVYSGAFHAGLRDGAGETLLPGGTRYASRWMAGVEETGRRPDAIADARVSGLLKADSTGGDAGRTEISVAVDARMNQQAADNNSMSYDQLVRDDAILVFSASQEARDAWNGTGLVSAGGSFIYSYGDEEDGSAFLQVGVKTADGGKAKLDSLGLDVTQSQVYRKPMFSLQEHGGCVGFRPTFSILNHGWGDPHNTSVNFAFVTHQPEEDGEEDGQAAASQPELPHSRTFSVPVSDFSEGTDVSLEETLQQAGVDTQKLATKRYNCQSRESMGVCRAQLFNDVGFGEIADFVWSDEYEPEHFYATAAGTIDYDWSDDGGQSYHVSEPFRVNIAVATMELPAELAECGDGYGGPPEARRYQVINLEPGRSGYSVDMPIRGNRNVSSYTARLKMSAPMSSFHQFHVTARFADGSMRESKPVSLYYFRSKPTSFETKTKPATCYLPEQLGCG